jgi:protein-L-isoaspartate(D-aspartate) O-methyltransferase
VNVITADGEYGHPDSAPYDRIIVTAGAWDLPPTWFDQLDNKHGRLVVPLRIRGQSRIITFAPDKGVWRSKAIEFAGFVPMRGDGAHASQIIPLTPDSEVQLHTDDPADTAKLTHALDYPVTQTWTGVTIPRGTSYEHLDLWLAGMRGFSRLTATPDAIARSVVHPTFPWGASAIHDNGTIAYLTERPAAPHLDTSGNQQRAAEIGIHAHGPTSTQLAQTVADHIRTFDRHHRTKHQAVIEAHPNGHCDAPDSDTVIIKRHVRLVLSWRSNQAVTRP